MFLLETNVNGVLRCRTQMQIKLVMTFIVNSRQINGSDDHNIYECLWGLRRAVKSVIQQVIMAATAKLAYLCQVDDHRTIFQSLKASRQKKA